MKIKTVLSAPLLAVFLLSVRMTAQQQYLYRSIALESAEAIKTAGLPEQNKTSPTAATACAKSVEVSGTEEPPEFLPKEAAALADIDFSALRNINGDIIGWIEIPDTELSYPLLQGTDNQFYLSHNWKGEASGGGSVFLEYNSSPDFTDFHTMVYAHRMRNDTMFGILKYYNNLEFLQVHPSIYVATEDVVLQYDIFAAQESAVYGIVYRLDLTENNLEEEFLKFCVDNSVIDAGVTPEAGDKILTLSTCTGNGHVNRWIVQGYLSHIYNYEGR